MDRSPHWLMQDAPAATLASPPRPFSPPSRRRRLWSLSVVVALCLHLGPTAVAASEQPAGTQVSLTEANIDSSGIPLVTMIEQPRPSSEEEAQAVSDAQVFAENHPDDVGYPWLDSATGRLELSATSAAGRDLLGKELAAFKSAPQIRNVQFSYGKLSAIADGVTRLAESGVPDSELIYRTAPDYRSNRIVIWVSGPSKQLFSELADRYGTEAIAVLIDPESRGGSPLSRDMDISPFWGGARISAPAGACSDAFAWHAVSGGDRLLTAAHCAPLGGSVSIGGSAAGSVTANSEENWSNTAGGTQLYTGQTTYRGDAALIRLNSGKLSEPRLYRGSKTSNTSSSVLSTLHRFSFVNENVYFSGATSGETGLYHINVVGANHLYTSGCGPNCYARNIVLAAATTSLNPCVAGGDSGGALFRSVTGGVQAVGTLSGQALSPCDIVFTDIYNSFLGLPGDVLTF